MLKSKSEQIEVRNFPRILKAALKSKAIWVMNLSLPIIIFSYNIFLSFSSFTPEDKVQLCDPVQLFYPILASTYKIHPYLFQNFNIVKLSLVLLNYVNLRLFCAIFSYILSENTKSRSFIICLSCYQGLTESKTA